MRETNERRGFQDVYHEGYPAEDTKGDHRVVGCASTIGDYEDSFEKPGSSFLWLGQKHHLNREEVAQLVIYLQHWLQTGRLF